MSTSIQTYKYCILHVKLINKIIGLPFWKKQNKNILDLFDGGGGP